jgi:predicted phage tail protein
MKRSIYLHGQLGEKYGKVFQLDVTSAGETIRALSANFPDFRKDVIEGAWHFVRGEDIDTGFSLDAEQVASFRLGKGDLHIVPYIAGSKRGGLLKVVLGVALFGLGIWMGFATPIFAGAAASGGALGGITYGNLAMLGASLALAGVSQLMAPEAKSESDEGSFAFSGPGSAYEQGSPVPLVYGFGVITGSVLVSGGIDVEQLQ